MDACAPCSVKAQALPEETSRELIGDFLEQLSRAGITGTTDITVLPEPAEITENMRIIRELELENRLSVRLHLYPSLGMDDSFRIVERYRQEFQSDKFRVSGLKAFIDGVHGNHTAFLLSPYADSPGEKGSTFYPQEQYRHMVTAANRAGYGVKLHCTGEGAVHMALDAFAASAHAKCSSGVRNSIEHVETFCEDDIDRFHELDVTASMQPSHLMFLGDTLRVKLGPERASRQYALKTMLDHDVNVAFSTDYPVAPFDPRLNIYFAVTRCDPEGNPVSRGSGQEITLAQAIRAYTCGSAYCLGREENLGLWKKANWQTSLCSTAICSDVTLRRYLKRKWSADHDGRRYSLQEAGRMKNEEGGRNHERLFFKDENGKIYYGWWIVLTAAVVTGFVYSGIVSATGAFMLPVTQDLGLSVAAYSLYLTIMSLTSILTLVTVSKHMDRKNIKKLMITAGVVGIISFAGFALAQNLWMFYMFAVPPGVLLRSNDDDAMSAACVQLVR